MPSGDRTGPLGIGPMTGHGAGFCKNDAAQGSANPAQFSGEFGCGFGHGRGSGFCRMFYATRKPRWARCGFSTNTRTKTATFDEKAFLSNQALEKQLQQVKERLSSLNQEAE